MLTAIRIQDKTKVIANKCAKGKDLYACPECGKDVVLKRGTIKTAHFAHKPPVTCEYGAGESEEHRQCKMEIYELLAACPHLICEMEKKVGNVRPDIFFESKNTGKQYAIEIQLSNLSLERIIARTEEYNRLGIYVLWMPQYSKNLLSKCYSPRIWEKWLHTLYYGRVYYWEPNAEIKAFRLDPYLKWVEMTDFGGGYFKTSKRYREPRFLGALNLLEDFQGCKRGGWNGGKIEVPDCMIMLDSLIKMDEKKAKKQIMSRGILVQVPT